MTSVRSDLPVFNIEKFVNEFNCIVLQVSVEDDCNLKLNFFLENELKNVCSDTFNKFLSRIHSDEQYIFTSSIFEALHDRQKLQVEIKLKGDDEDYKWYSCNFASPKSNVVDMFLFEVSNQKDKENTLKNHIYSLSQHAKVINVLHKVSVLINCNTDVDLILKQLIVLLPKAFLFPDLACIKISLNNQNYISETISNSPLIHFHKEIIYSLETQVGFIEILYPFTPISADVDTPIRPEEKVLLSTVALMIGKFLSATFKLLPSTLPVNIYENASRIINGSAQAIIITDTEANIVEANSAFQKLTGYSFDELVGKKPNILASGKHKNDFYTDMWDEILSKGGWQGEVFNKTKSGVHILLDVKIIALSDTNHVVRNYVAIYKEISYVRHADEQFSLTFEHDALTGLPNKLSFIKELQDLITRNELSGNMVPVLYFDIDDFRTINSTFGEDFCNKLLVNVSNYFRNNITGADCIARIGGDEFAIALANLKTIEEVESKVASLFYGFHDPKNIGEKLTISLGVTIFPEDGVDSEKLLRHADQAMLNAKILGKSRFEYFNTKENQATIAHANFLETISKAISNEEFILYYQPKVNLTTLQIYGAEALIRWQHPEKGLLGPSTFLPFIEDTQLSIKLGDWVIRQAISQLNEWLTEGINISVSVNASAVQLSDSNFLSNLRELLDQYPSINPSDLEIEILESAAIHDFDETALVIYQANSIGVKFSLDDFGTGFSSLSYLKKLPVKTIKIDQSFIRDMLQDEEDMAIVKGVLGIAMAFNRDVVAEGIETAAQITELCHMGCMYGQGYAIARPMPPDELKKWYVRNFKKLKTFDSSTNHKLS